jgi:hypothetical protein
MTSNIAGQRRTDAVITASYHRGGGDSCPMNLLRRFHLARQRVSALELLCRQGLNMLMADKLRGRCCQRIRVRPNAKALA